MFYIVCVCVCVCVRKIPTEMWVPQPPKRSQCGERGPRATSVAAVWCPCMPGAAPLKAMGPLHRSPWWQDPLGRKQGSQAVSQFYEHPDNARQELTSKQEAAGIASSPVCHSPLSPQH